MINLCRLFILEHNLHQKIISEISYFYSFIINFAIQQQSKKKQNERKKWQIMVGTPQQHCQLQRALKRGTKNTAILSSGTKVNEIIYIL